LSWGAGRGGRDADAWKEDHPLAGAICAIPGAKKRGGGGGKDAGEGKKELPNHNCSDNLLEKGGKVLFQQKKAAYRKPSFKTARRGREGKLTPLPEKKRKDGKRPHETVGSSPGGGTENVSMGGTKSFAQLIPLKKPNRRNFNTHFNQNPIRNFFFGGISLDSNLPPLFFRGGDTSHSSPEEASTN